MDLDTGVAHPARVYDYWLGGKDNFAADREAARQAIAAFPGVISGVKANRAFLGRAVRFLAAGAGIRQFLDIGTGLPTVDNTHEVAQRIAPECRVVYADNDPTGDIDTQAMTEMARRLNARSAPAQMTLRTHAQISRFFDRLELVEPGLVPVNRWRLDDGAPEVPNFCAVARKP